MASLAELAILLTARDTASATIDKVTGKAGGLGKAFIAGAAAGGTALVGMGIALNNLGGEFDSVYDNIRSTTGATGEVLDGLKDSFKNVVQDIPADFGLAGQVIADLATRTGQTGKSLEDLSKNIIEMSRLTGTDAAANVALATRVFGDWSIATEHQSATLDKVLRAGQLTGISVADLMQKVVQFGAPLRAMNFSFEESVAMLGKWEKEGVNTELVLGSLRIAMGDFARQNIPMRKGLEDTIAEIQRLGPSAATTSLAMKVFGARAGPDMAAAILEGRFALGDLVDQISNGKDTILGLSEETADASEKMKLAFNRLKIAAEPLANVVFLGVAKAADLFAKASLVAIPVMQRLGVVLTTKFQAALPTLTAVGKQFVTLGQYIRTVVRGGDTLNDFLADLSPSFRGVAFVIGTSITQLRTLGRAFLEVLRSPIVGWLKDALGSILEFAFGIRNLGADVALASGPLTAIATAVTGLVVAAVAGPVLGLVTAVGGLAASVVTFPVKTLVDAAGAVGEFVKNAAGLVSKAISVTANFVTTGAEALANLLTNKSIDVKPKLGDTSEFDDFFSRERTISAKVDAKDISIPKPAAENAVLKAFSGLGTLLGPILGTAFGFALNNPTLRTTVGTALSRLGGPWGRAAGLAAGLAFAVAFEEVGAPVGAAFLEFSGIDIEGWQRGFKAIDLELDTAIAGYKLAWENMDFWGVVASLSPASWGANFALITEALGLSISDWKIEWNKLPEIFVPPQFNVALWIQNLANVRTTIDTAISGYRLAWQAMDLGNLPPGIRNQLDEFTREVERWRTRIADILNNINPFATRRTAPALGGAGGQGEEETGFTQPESPIGSPRLVTREAFEAMQGQAAGFVLPAPDISGFTAAFEDAQSSVISTLDGIRESVANEVTLSAPDTSGFTGALEAAQTSVMNTLDGLRGAIASGLGEIGIPDTSGFTGAFANARDSVISTLDDLRTNVASTLGGIGTAVSRFGRDLQADFVGAMSRVVAQATLAWRDLPTNIGRAVADALEPINSFVSNAFQALQGFTPWDWIKAGWDGLVSGIRSGVDVALGLIARLRGAAAQPITVAAPSFSAPSFAGGGGSRGPSEATESGEGSPFSVPSFSPPPISLGGNQGEEESLGSRIREVFTNAAGEFWSRIAGSFATPPAGFEFAYPESFQTALGQFKQVPGAASQGRLAMVHGGEIIGRPSGGTSNTTTNQDDHRQMNVTIVTSSSNASEVLDRFRVDPVTREFRRNRERF